MKALVTYLLLGLVVAVPAGSGGFPQLCIGKALAGMVSAHVEGGYPKIDILVAQGVKAGVKHDWVIILDGGRWKAIWFDGEKYIFSRKARGDYVATRWYSYDDYLDLAKTWGVRKHYTQNRKGD